MSDDLDDFTRERAQQPRRLPVTFSGGGHAVAGSSPVVTATEQDIRKFGHGGHVCGECRFFEPGHAAAEMARTRFVSGLVKDYGWKVEHAFPGITQERTAEIGLCAAAGDTGTTAFAAACDHFKDNAGALKREAKDDERAFVINDMRQAKAAQEERFQQWKRDQGLDGPGGE